jgi:hypothetical protein
MHIIASMLLSISPQLLSNSTTDYNRYRNTLSVGPTIKSAKSQDLNLLYTLPNNTLRAPLLI